MPHGGKRSFQLGNVAYHQHRGTASISVVSCQFLRTATEAEAANILYCCVSKDPKSKILTRCHVQPPLTAGSATRYEHGVLSLGWWALVTCVHGGLALAMWAW